MLTHALNFASNGWHVLPVKNRQKLPHIIKWQDEATTDEETIRKWWNEWPNANIGVQLGEKSGIIDVECDSPEAEIQLLELIGDVDPPTFIGKRGYHRLFAWQDGMPKRAVIKIGEIEVRLGGGGKGAQTVFPPSVHPGGAVYTWKHNGTPPPIPEKLLNKIIGIEEAPRVVFSSPSSCTQDLSERIRKYLATVEPAIEGSNGSKVTYRVACTLVLGYNLSIADAIPFFNEYSMTCQPPWSEKELIHKLSDADKEVGPRGWLLHQDNQIGPQPDLSNILKFISVKPIPVVEVEEEKAEENNDCLLSVPGFIDEFVDICMRGAHYPNRNVAFAAAISALGWLSGRKVSDSGDLRTVIYMMALANPGGGKNFPRQLIQKIGREAGISNTIGERFASGQGLEDALGITPNMIFLTDEFDTELRQISQGKDTGITENKINMLLKLFTSANEDLPRRCRAIPTVKKRGEEQILSVIHQPHLCMLATCPPKGFYEALNERLLSNGLFSRLIILHGDVRSDGQDPENVDLTHIMETVKWWVDFNPDGGTLPCAVRFVKPAIVPSEPSAKDFFHNHRINVDDEYSSSEKRKDDVGMTVWGRANEQVRRLALFYAISENHRSPTISIRGAEWAAKFMDIQIRKMLFMATQYTAANPFHELCLKFKRKLREYPDRTITRSKMMQSMKIDIKMMDIVINTLIAQNDIVAIAIHTSGRPATGYKLICE